MEIWIVTIILLTALFLLISEKISVDLTATGIMVALMLSGVLSAKEAVAGFANPAGASTRLTHPALGSD